MGNIFTGNRYSNVIIFLLIFRENFSKYRTLVVGNLSQANLQALLVDLA